MHDINETLLEVEKQILEALNSIDKEQTSKETRSLIHAIDRLVNYFDHRSKFEQEFSANVSHELRTPLTGIRLQTELAMDNQSAALQETAHRNILKAVGRSERLIEQLLILSRLSIDHVELVMEEVNIGQLSSHVVGELVEMADRKQVELAMCPWSDCYIKANGASLSILIHNLIRNAITYSPKGEKVTIEVTTDQNNVLLSVTDSGPGIPPDQHKLILKRFKKVGNETKSGSGLGLSIVKRICDLHDATLDFRKATISGGLKVTVIFA